MNKKLKQIISATTTVTVKAIQPTPVTVSDSYLEMETGQARKSQFQSL